MEVSPFLESFREVNHRVVELLGSMSALSALSTLESQGYNEPELLHGVLRILLENQDVERCSIFMLQDEGLVNASGADWSDVLGNGSLYSAVSEGAEGEPTIFQLGEGVIGQAAVTGEMQHCHNCRLDSRFTEKSEAKVENASGSLICMPISVAGRLLGVLSAYHPMPDSFSRNHERFMELFASFVGQILMNVRHVQKLEQNIHQRTRQLEEALVKTKELKERFKQLSIIDELTELHNRRFFFPEAQTALSRALRHGRPFGLIILDLDHFKHVNDQYGHAAGDGILRGVAALLKQKIRAGDILARFGGEEFVLALPETDGDGARQLAERILQAIRGHDWKIHGNRCRVTASIGLAVLGEAGESESPSHLLDRLLQESDQALYVSKEGGRDRCSFFDAASPATPTVS